MRAINSSELFKLMLIALGGNGINEDRFFSTPIPDKFREVIRERTSRENETRTRDREGWKSRGSTEAAHVNEKGDPRDRVHAYATISFDYIIACQPGGIIRVNKLHIFFYSAPPIRRVAAVVLLSRFCRR